MKRLKLWLVSLALLIPTILFSLSVSAAEITVNTTIDQGGEGPECSLREAITSANTDAALGFGGCTAGMGDDTITLPAGTYRLTNPAGQLVISSNIRINGAGRETTIIDGNATSRVISVDPVRVSNIQISNVTIQNGAPSFFPGIEGAGLIISASQTVLLQNVIVQDNNSGTSMGGGVNNRGALTINNSIIRRNRALMGGGINNNGTLIISGSELSANTSTTGGGGGLANAGADATIRTVTITDSVISNNTTTSLGGGIFSGGARSNITIDRSTIMGNSATVYGGGIRDDATLTITNSTIVNNSTNGAGAGIMHGIGSMSLTNVTIAFNRADEDIRGGESGGGIYIFFGAVGSMRNTIIARNLLRGATVGAGVDCFVDGATLTSLGYNLVGNANGCTFTAAAGDQIGSDASPISALLATAVASNGGLTPTLALLTGSPAIDAGDPAAPLATDQRGVRRSNRSDIGAFEFAAVLTPTGCGDGVIAPGEFCDNGPANANVRDACRTNCTLPRCGDGILDTGEACDDGNTVDDDNCRNICALPTCGDDVVQMDEECDDGRRNSNTAANACRLNCMRAFCGDGVVDVGESCDDGNRLDGDSCPANCGVAASPMDVNQRLSREVGTAVPDVTHADAAPSHEALKFSGGGGCYHSLSGPPSDANPWAICFIIFPLVIIGRRRMRMMPQRRALPPENDRTPGKE